MEAKKQAVIISYSKLPRKLTMTGARTVGGLKSAGVEFFAGVLDSLLKGFCAYVTGTCGEKHLVAANEGGTGDWEIS